MSKTNIFHLKEICADNDEAIEFIEAIEEELKAANDGWDEADTAMRKCEERSDEIERELNEIKEEGPGNIIKTPSGNIKWAADNLQHIAIFEALAEKIN